MLDLTKNTAVILEVLEEVGIPQPGMQLEVPVHNQSTLETATIVVKNDGGTIDVSVK